MYVGLEVVKKPGVNPVFSQAVGGRLNTTETNDKQLVERVPAW